MTLAKIFGKLFFWTILFLIIADSVSFAGYLIPPAGQAAFFVVLLAVLAASLVKLEYGLYLLLAEIFTGGFGQLFSLNLGGFSLSIRLGIFLVVLAVWLAKKITRRQKLLLPNTYYLIPNTYHLLPYLLLASAIAIGLINGLWHNEFSKVFFDANAWAWFILIFVFWEAIKAEKVIENILQILTGATAYLALKTVGILLLFSHNFTGLGGVFYKWLRDTGVGEITYISGTLFRVFLQSQLYCLIGFLIILTILISQFRLKAWKNYLVPAIYLYLTGLAVIISQSRSYWVGGVAAIFGLIVLSWLYFGFRFKKTAWLLLALVVIFTSQLYLVQLISGNFSGNVIADRFKNLPGEAAGISRLNELQPLSQAIFQHLIFGSGFGKELTYQSNDPRILKAYPGGIYTTAAFEWGYLDIMLKLGLAGLAIYLGLIGQIFYQGIKRLRNQRAESRKQSNLQPTSYKLQAGLLLGLAALCVTNIFSPYLNHPLGITYIILVSVICNNYD
ncbi:MAG: hypothetical protein WC768_02895 [Patescibacteria group bacterium]|jgi:hypothetical protein